MPFSLQTAYKTKGSYEQGDVVAIRPEGFQYSYGDCLKEWLASGRDLSDWRELFVINYITDESMNGTEPEVLALIEMLGEPEDAVFKKRKKKLLKPSDYDNPNRKELRETGETRVSWSVISSLISEKV